ncbi:MAG: glycoside hydrolase family 38 C-terminal domain-containing protein [Candidatus Thorarchaeota archaeon]
MDSKKIIIVPHTHWDREWYLPFQHFRYKLVQLIDELLRILNEQDFTFMLDGQTVVLEDYSEIRPERMQELLKRIRKGKISVGPWYLLPDEWLVGGESLIRNLEYSQDYAAELKIPLMDIAYLPDQFGHTSGMPQLLGDLTNLKTTMLWRGIPRNLTEVPFIWKSHESSETSVKGVYLPFGYGNATMLPTDYDEFVDAVNEKVSELEPFSPVPYYLLMNGSDHLFPQPFTKEYAKRMSSTEFDVSVSNLKDFVGKLDNAITESQYTPQVLHGEFRSSARANLLQDTYSARMWIKQWNQKVEDRLTRQVEPLWMYLSLASGLEYPHGFLTTAWKWLLKNQPHDSICGCSVDQTHEEMKTRYSWAESICEGALKDAEKSMHKIATPSNESAVVVFNAGGSSRNPVYIEFTAPGNKSVKGLQTEDGEIYDAQKLTSREDVFLDTTVGLTAARMGMRLLPGRKLMDFYINGVEYFDGDEPGLLELRFIADRHPVGEFDMQSLKQEANEIIGSKKYKKIHLVASRPTQSVYASVIPLKPWAFSKLIPVEDSPKQKLIDKLEVDKNGISNRFYSLSFNKDGSLNLTNKNTGENYQRLHVFEDYGDRGDEYSFGRVEPEKVRVKSVKRTVISSGPIIAEIKQTLTLEVFESIDPSREKRIGKTEIPIHSVFRFYRDDPRIEVTTKLTNTAKDHRLRICFDLPFNSDTTLTSTHFGYINRSGTAEEIPDASELERTRSEYPEKPSGIQPQKGFIRIDDEKGTDAVTVLNKGLPEVELVNGHRVALTLLRCVGWLSRSDYPERPIHAGPAEETPGAQEMNQEYEYHYGFVVHARNDPMTVSAEQADVFHSDPIVFGLDSVQPPSNLFNPILQLNKPEIRISSMRMRGNSILATLYNIENTNVEVQVNFSDKIKTATEVRIDGTITNTLLISDSTVVLSFSPREIRMCRLQYH